MKLKMIKILLVLTMVGMAAFYLYDIFANGTPPMRHIFRTLAVEFLCLANLLRAGHPRMNLKFYAAQYQDILEHAFADQPFWKNKLLCAVRLYNEENYPKALKYLADLKGRCRAGEDHYAVNLFAALTLTDMGLYEQAQKLYQALINMELATSQVYSNLGQVQNAMGEREKALRSYEYALDYDRDNAYAYNNIAQAHFQMHNLSEAIPYAEKALEINPKLHQASALLAITYHLLDDKENGEKYFHIAISSGRDPKELKEAIEFYRAAKAEEAEV